MGSPSHSAAIDGSPHGAAMSLQWLFGQEQLVRSVASASVEGQIQKRGTRLSIILSAAGDLSSDQGRFDLP